MAKARKKTEAVSQVQRYLGVIAAYDREFKPWETRNDKILKRFRDEKRDNKDRQAKFNILWSNVQTLVPACFSRLPKPDVSRRFRDQDQVGRVAALILERALEFEVQHYTDYRSSMRQVVHDRFLGGRGTCWARYEPHFKQGQVQKLPDDGSQITEDVDATAIDEQLDYECAPIDYVHWKDFGHSVARTWEEVTVVWRKVYMGESAVEKRFGAEVAKKIPYDATPEELKRAARDESDLKKQALVYEIWDKEEGCAYWMNKAMPDFLDERDDPLGLQDFFPCPKPLFATLTNESLIPVPDFTLYQDQAISLDTLADRICGLVEMLQVKGVYDGSADAAVGRLFTEGMNGTLLPVKNWAQFAEKNGIAGQIDVLDLKMIADALKSAIEAFAQTKEEVYEITGISDIIRGQTMASETATAQQIKGQFASLRLRAMQDDVARFATDCLQLKAQIMCAKFNPKTIAAISAVEQLQEEDKQYILPALTLLVGQERLQDPASEAPNPLRSFRVEVAADTLVQLDETQEKQDRMEMLGAFSQFMEKAFPVAAQAPALIPLVVEVAKFGLGAFKVGKAIEGTFDQALDALKKQAAQPKPPDPAMQAEQAKAQAAQQKAQLDVQTAQAKAGIEMQKMQGEQQMQQQQMQIDQQQQQQQMAMDEQQMQQQAAHQHQTMEMKRQQAQIQHEQQIKRAMQPPARRQ